MPITQAGKTIIFEQFTDRNFKDGSMKSRLDFMLDDNMSDGDMIEIEKELSVASYSEFIEKFKPVIYKRQVMNTDTGEVYFEYTLDEPSGEYDIIDVTQQDFYKTIMRIYEKKKASGNDNFDFDYESAKSSLIPEKISADIKKTRALMIHSLEKSLEFSERKNSAMAKKHYVKANKAANSLGKMLFSKDMTKLLPVLIDDVNTKIKSYEKVEEQNKTIGLETHDAPKLLTCFSSFDEEGNLINTPVTSEKQNNRDVKMLTSSKEQILTIVSNHVDNNCVPEIKENAFIRNALISVLCGSQNTSELTVLPQKSELVQRRDSYIKMYQKVQESFAKQMVDIVEKLVNIRAFFDHTGTNGILKQNQKAIIANCTIADLMEDYNKENFKKFMDFLGNQSNNNKLWYAIVPSIADKNFKDEDSDDEAIDYNGLGNEYESSKEDDKLDLTAVKFDDFKEYCVAMKDSKVMTFFNFKANEKTGFSKLSIDIVNKYKEMCEVVEEKYKEYSVLCYPNFTILPKDQRKSMIGKVLCDVEEDGVIIPNGGEETVYIDTPSVYINSAYIACGMMIAAHDNEYIKSKLKDAELSTEHKYPAVRFDYEGAVPVNHSHVTCRNVFTSKMNRELKYNMSQELKMAIGRFGFCFGSDELIKSGKKIDNSYVVSARTIADEELKNSDGTIITVQVKPIFKTIISTFIVMLFNSYGGDDEALRVLEEETEKWSYDSYLELINNPLYNTFYGGEEKECVRYERVNNNTYKVIVMYGPSPSEITLTT